MAPTINANSIHFLALLVLQDLSEVHVSSVSFITCDRKEWGIFDRRQTYNSRRHASRRLSFQVPEILSLHRNKLVMWCTKSQENRHGKAVAERNRAGSCQPATH